MSSCALPVELTIYTAGETRAACLNWLSACTEDVLAVDGAQVAEVDGAGVQLLAALGKSLAAQQRRLQLLQPSRALQGACNGLGFGELLENAA